MRERCPFHHHRSDIHDFYVTSRYDEIKRDVLADNPVWSFKFGNAAKDTMSDVGVVTDNPFHKAFRAVLLPAFSARALQGYTAQIEPEHSKLMFNIAGANRDPEKFPDPEMFRLDRPITEARQHLSFGSGVHLCLGAPIARLEAKIAMRLLIERLPGLRLAGPGERIHTWLYPDLYPQIGVAIMKAGFAKARIQHRGHRETQRATEKKNSVFSVAPLATSNSPTLGRVKFPQAGHADCRLSGRCRVDF